MLFYLSTMLRIKSVTVSSRHMVSSSFLPSVVCELQLTFTNQLSYAMYHASPGNSQWRQVLLSSFHKKATKAQRS